MPNYVLLADHKNSPEDIKRAKELRRSSSFVEQAFWHELQIAAKASGYRFRRQHPIHPFIVDFVCLKIRLIIELDGDSHDVTFEQDKSRETYLRNLGYEIMRFTNNDVMTNRDGVIQIIFDRAKERFVPLP